MFCETPYIPKQFLLTPVAVLPTLRLLAHAWLLGRRRFFVCSWSLLVLLLLSLLQGNMAHMCCVHHRWMTVVVVVAASYAYGQNSSPNKQNVLRSSSSCVSIQRVLFCDKNHGPSVFLCERTVLLSYHNDDWALLLMLLCKFFVTFFV